MCSKMMSSGFLAVFALGCTVGVLDAGQINFADFNSTAGLNLQGSAAKSGNALRLNPSQSAQVGSAWFATQQAVADGFTTTFQFQITQLGGITDDDGNTGADGLAFVIQNQSSTALGSNAAGMGYRDITNSVAVEFDTFRNSVQGDPNGNHISVQTNGTGANSEWHNHSLGCVTNLPNMSDGTVHTASVLYQPGTMTISLDSATVLSVPLNLTSELNLTGGKAWAGFTAATFAAYENHDVLNWSMTTVPEPSGFPLLGMGAVCILVFLWRWRKRTITLTTAGRRFRPLFMGDDEIQVHRLPSLRELPSVCCTVLGKHCGQCEGVAGAQLDRLRLDLADSHLGAGQVGHDGDAYACGELGDADARDAFGVTVEVAVREVQPRDVQPRSNEAFQHLWRF